MEDKPLKPLPKLRPPSEPQPEEPMQLIPILQNQLQILEIHKGHPLKREIFVNSIAHSKTIKDLKIAFDWQIGPKAALETIIVKNTSIRKLHLVVEGYDNDLCFINYIR